MDLRFHRSTAIVLALACASVPAIAQQAGTPQSKPVTPPDPGPQPDGQVPGPNATMPQHRNTAPQGQTSVQPVPGAMPGSDTVPSTISERNAADDKLITTAYTFKHLTDEQRRAIFDALKKKQPAGAAFNADVGVILPPEVRLHPMPNDVVKQAPHTEGFQYAVTNDRVLLILPANRIVAGVLHK